MFLQVPFPIQPARLRTRDRSITALLLGDLHHTASCGKLKERAARMNADQRKSTEEIVAQSKLVLLETFGSLGIDPNYEYKRERKCEASGWNGTRPASRRRRVIDGRNIEIRKMRRW